MALCGTPAKRLGRCSAGTPRGLASSISKTSSSSRTGRHTPPFEAGSSVREIVLEDMSAKEREESVQDRAKAELETLLASLESGVVIFDAGGAIRHVNHAFGELFGLDRTRTLELGNAKALAARLMDCFSDSEKYAARWHEAVSGGGSGSREE